MARRVKRESGRGSSPIASVATASGEDLLIANEVSDRWRAVQQMAYNWKWMRKMLNGVLSLGLVEQDISALGAPDFSRWVPESDYYRPTAYEASNPQSEWDLRYLQFDRFRSMFLVGTPSPAAPQYWSQSPGGKLLIGPAPDLATYHFRGDYFSVPTELVNDADTPGMPSQFHMLLVWMALEQMSSIDAAPEVYRRAQANAEADLNSLIEHQGDDFVFSLTPLA